MDFNDVLSNPAAVIDNGSGVIKAGFAGEEQPRCFFSSFVGRPKHSRIMAGAVEGDKFIGKRAQELRGLLRVKYPMEHGIVTDWDDMEMIWQYIYSEELKVGSEEQPVLLTEAPLNPRQHREQTAAVFFDTFNVPALFMSIQAVLALYASGRTTGIVLDSGDGVTHAVPVYEGFSMPNAIRRVDIAGRDVTDHLQLLLRKSGTALHTSAEREIVRIIKEKACYIALNPSKEEKDASAKYDDFELPDGNIIKLGVERFRAPEILFTPDLVGLEYPGVHQLVVDCISKADMDVRKSLYANIVLSGGSTLCRGFGDRLLNEVKKLTLRDMKIKIFAPPERKWSTWIGGSILASLSTFKKMWVSAEEYQEDPDVIHKKMSSSGSLFCLLPAFSRSFSASTFSRNELSPKIAGLVQSISSLTLLETNALVQALKTELNIKDAAPIMQQMILPTAAASAPVIATAEEAPQEKPQEKTEFTIKLEKVDATAKAKVIKEIKTLNPTMTLVDAKKFVESVPKVLKENVPKEEAEKLKKALETAGATVILE
ncbi:Actin-2 [Nowakowskiella sp. JEL0078]|nr:Actin-2 [Nowakowskiella sp. JEL0078]